MLAFLIFKKDLQEKSYKLFFYLNQKQPNQTNFAKAKH